MFTWNLTWGSSNRGLWLLYSSFIFFIKIGLICHYKIDISSTYFYSAFNTIIKVCMKWRIYPRCCYRMKINCETFRIWSCLSTFFFRMNEIVFDLNNAYCGVIQFPIYLTFRILEWYKLWLSKSLHMWKAQQLHKLNSSSNNIFNSKRMSSNLAFLSKQGTITNKEHVGCLAEH